MVRASADQVHPDPAGPVGRKFWEIRPHEPLIALLKVIEMHPRNLLTLTAPLDGFVETTTGLVCAWSGRTGAETISERTSAENEGRACRSTAITSDRYGSRGMGTENAMGE